MTRRRRVLMTVGWAVLLTTGALGQPGPTEPEAFERACRAVDEGASLRSSAPEAAAAKFRLAADLFAGLLEDGASAERAWNAGLLRNAGLAAHLAGDRARAVLFLRRSAFLDPLSAPLREALALARAPAASTTRAATPVHGVDGETGRPVPLLERVASYAQLAPPLVGVAAALGGWMVVAGVGAWRALARGRGRPPGWIMAAGGLVALGGAATLVPFEVLREASGEAVVMAAAPVLSGPDDVRYGPVGEAARPGDEVRVVGRRGEWACVETGTGARGWMAGASLRRVFGD